MQVRGVVLALLLGLLIEWSFIGLVIYKPLVLYRGGDALVNSDVSLTGFNWIVCEGSGG